MIVEEPQKGHVDRKVRWLRLRGQGEHGPRARSSQTETRTRGGGRLQGITYEIVPAKKETIGDLKRHRGSVWPCFLWRLTRIAKAKPLPGTYNRQLDLKEDRIRQVTFHEDH